MSVRLHVIVAAYNCEKLISTCMKMLSLQTYDNWDGIVADDASTDNTVSAIKSRIPNNMKIIINKKRKRILANQYHAVSICKPADEDVIVIVDGDDRLFTEDSLKKLAEYYENPDVWMTYGSYIIFPSGKRGVDPVAVPKDFDFRRGKWILSHLRTYKYFLWKNILLEDLKSKETDDFFGAAVDFCTMKPMAEMAGWEHIKYIPDILYVYNQGISKKDRIHCKIQLILGREVLAKPRYRKRTKQELITGIINR